MDSRLAAILLVSFFCLIALRKFAIAIALVDLPSERKHHRGSVPLVGGLAIFFTVALFSLLTPSIGGNTALYLLFAAILIATGTLDDKFDISVKARLIIQLIITLMMFRLGDIQLSTLGNILSWGDITFTNTLAIIVTFLAVAGAINAFNMVDGIDGLLGGLSVITFSSMAYLFSLSGQSDLYQLSLLIVIATLPYILLNLGFPFGTKLKIFMGDAGSMFIGFTVVWLLLSGSQSEVSSFRPVTALWLIALPLMDMAAIMIRRVRKGQSPFKPDREHLHHICQRIGLSSKMTLLTICTVAVFFAAIGIVGELSHISESVMFFSFVLMFAGYYAAICHIWRVTTFIRKVSTLLPLNKETPTVSDGEQR
ncbi:UDP-N-acetylglucosamine--undecaprenyl-phosphate N-acetylglucosaminephosphotransferase [Photobacterium lutimaris]|uniref:Undecaprenyl-phosphate alpha-N-acetylglucosaminyl 1-phosphate transferase n=1 Tax=Photobacterium lutimaris TaxID=388278 RepID=A0A2T3IXC4_9GAMM|nr:UDP-N-acetylglucosamine--undecaprenyl-phosphate N-acetylglucosaminephosphotransferase [Photobacterium lutimaris]PSU33185.1 undecaprenyl-phosphate alpha-N-acetylglucosaminyl 1-phosphate transferase [Photobacterium lutimaris]TDR75236.1 UDP-GlcNAc:undecaprenyl-phosphate GlcNAc-1-phosphate transferase [Photobacterium lutimaris]